MRVARSPMASAAVLDSSVVLAVLLNEPGADAAITLLQGGQLSTVNLLETHARMLFKGASASHSWSRILSLGCEVCPLTERQAQIAAELGPVTRAYGLSLGDRACLALAIERKATVYTTDRVWSELDLGIEVVVIR
jgi:ribonuclease VapC